MNRALKLLSVVFAILLLGGCAKPTWTTAGKIIPPLGYSCPLEGKWTVLKDLTASHKEGTDDQKWIGDVAQFTNGVAVLGNYVWKHPSYKIKKVNSTDYLMTKYLMISSTLVPDNKVVDVTTISTAENFLGEFIRIDDTKLIALVQSNVLLLQKVSNRVDSSLTEVNSNGFDINQQNQSRTSGVLLGLRVPDNKNVNYQTLWLAADNKRLHPLLTSNHIFFPRSSGFWELFVRNVVNGTESGNELSARDVSTKVSEVTLTTKNKLQKDQVRTSKRIIDYVGNDYVSIESEYDGINELQVLPVDKIAAGVGIKITDLFENGGYSVFNNARSQADRTLNNKGVTIIDKGKNPGNFGLIRKNGHWYLQGRINYQNQGQSYYMDYNINLIPPSKMITYDTLCLSWQTIKDRVPDAVDAFSSPNRDLALVITKTKLYIFGISGSQLDTEPLAKIGLIEGEDVIMAEWATGSYVDNWEKAFLAYGARIFNN